MEEWELLKQLGTTILGIVLTMLTFIFKGHKSQVVKKKILVMAKISNMLHEWIKEAEELRNYTGVEKKEYVLTKASRYALENKLDFCEDEIKDKIDDLINFTKSVNINVSKDATNKIINKNDNLENKKETNFLNSWLGE